MNKDEVIKLVFLYQLSRYIRILDAATSHEEQVTGLQKLFNDIKKIVLDIGVIDFEKEILPYLEENVAWFAQFEE